MNDAKTNGAFSITLIIAMAIREKTGLHKFTCRSFEGLGCADFPHTFQRVNIQVDEPELQDAACGEPWMAPIHGLISGCDTNHAAILLFIEEITKGELPK